MVSVSLRALSVKYQRTKKQQGRAGRVRVIMFHCVTNIGGQESGAFGQLGPRVGSGEEGSQQSGSELGSF